MACKRRAPAAGLALLLLALLLSGNVHQAEGGIGQAINKAIYKGCPWSHERALEADLRKGYLLINPSLVNYVLPPLQGTVDMCRFADEISGARTTYRRIVNGIGLGPTVEDGTSYFTTATFAYVRGGIINLCGDATLKDYAAVIPGIGLVVSGGGAVISVSKKIYYFFDSLEVSTKGVSRVPLGPVKLAAKAVSEASSVPKSKLQRLNDYLDKACPMGGKPLAVLRKLLDFYGFLQGAVVFFDGIVLPTAAKVGCSYYEGITTQALWRARGMRVNLTSFAGRSTPRCLPHYATAEFSGEKTLSRRRGRQLLAGPSNFTDLPSLPGWDKLAQGLEEIDGTLGEIRVALDGIEAKWSKLNDWASTASDKLGKLSKPLEPVLPVFKALGDIFKYLECPKWLNFLCNLDDLLTSLIDELFEALGIPPIREWIEALLLKIGLGPVIDLVDKAGDLLMVFEDDLDAQFDALVGKINATVKAKFGPLLSVDAWVPPVPDKVAVVDSKLWVRNLRLYDGAAATFDCSNLGTGSKPIVISAERDIEGCTQDFAKFIRIPCGNTDRFCTIDYNARYPTSCANVPRAVPADLAAELARFFGVAKLPSTDVTTISYYCVEPSYKLDLLAELFNGIGVDPAVLRGFGDILRADATKVPTYVTNKGAYPSAAARNTSTAVNNLRGGGNYGSFAPNGPNAPLLYPPDRLFGVAMLPNAFFYGPGQVGPSLGLYEGSTVVDDEISCGARQIYLEGTQAAASPGQGGFDPCFSYNWLINDKDDTECPAGGGLFLSPYECAGNGFKTIASSPNQFYDVWPAKWDLCRRIWSKQLDGQFVYDSRRWPLRREPALGPSADYLYAFADGTQVAAQPQRYGVYTSPTAATASETWDCEGNTLWLVVWRGFSCPGDGCLFAGEPQDCTDAVAVLPDIDECRKWIEDYANVQYVISTVKQSSWRCSDGSTELDLSGANKLQLTCVPWSADATTRFCRAGYPANFVLQAPESGLGFNLQLQNWPPATAPNTTYWAKPVFSTLTNFDFYKYLSPPITKLARLVKKQYDRGASHPDVAPCVGLEDRVRQRCKNGQHSCKPYDGETTGCRLPRLQWSCVEPEVFATEGTPVRLEYAFGDSLRASTPKNVTCPGGSLASVTDAAFGAVFTFEDVTDLLQPKCSGSTCLFTAADGVRNAGDTATGKVLRVRIFCACGAGRVPGLQPNSTCLPCQPGSYRNASMGACQLCPPGTFSSGGATACTPCARGQFSPDAGASGCQSCPRGTVGAGEGFANETDACTACPVNTYAASANASSCTPCAPGASTFGLDRQISCLSCGAGFVRPAGAASCTACLPGTFSPDDQAAACRLCGRGNYSATLNATQCSLCSVGTYQDQEGQIECKVCPNNTRTAGTGSASAADCYAPREVNYDEEERIFLEKLNVTSRRRLLALSGNGTYGEALCDAFLQLFNGTGNTTDSRLGQINNGFCNKGPFNTAICGFDGGDCCAATCVKRTLTQLNATTDAFGNVTGFTNVTVPWPASCADYTLACKDPATLKLGAPAGCRALRIEKAGTKAAANATCNATDPRIGNGLCDDELNLAACAYDGGDCCRATCKRNEGLSGSCIESNCRDPAVVNAAKFVDAVAPTIYGVPVDLRVQYTDPRFDALTALPTGLAASDNDPCYVSNVALVLNQTIRDRSKLPGGTLFRFVRVWRAVDASGNVANATQVVDALDVPPVNNKLSTPKLLGKPKALSATWQCDAVQAAPTVTASEAGKAVAVLYTETRVNGSCAGSYTLRRCWVATNIAGRSTTFNQTITVVDTTPPRSLTPPNPNWAVCVFAQPGKFGRIGSVSTDARFAFNRVADACSGVRPGVFVSCVPDTPVDTTASCTYNSATNTLTVPAALQPRVGRFDQPAFWRVTWRVRDGCGLATTLVQRVQVRPRARFDPPTACVTPS